MRAKKDDAYSSLYKKADAILTQAGFDKISRIPIIKSSKGSETFWLFIYSKENHYVIVQMFSTGDIDVLHSILDSEDAELAFKRLRSAIEPESNAGVTGSLTGADVKYGSPAEFINQPLIDKIRSLRSDMLER